MSEYKRAVIEYKNANEKHKKKKVTEWFQYSRKQGIIFAEFEKLVAPEITKGGNFSYNYKGD